MMLILQSAETTMVKGASRCTCPKMEDLDILTEEEDDLEMLMGTNIKL